MTTIIVAVAIVAIIAFVALVAPPVERRFPRRNDRLRRTRIIREIVATWKQDLARRYGVPLTMRPIPWAPVADVPRPSLPPAAVDDGDRPTPVYHDTDPAPPPSPEDWEVLESGVFGATGVRREA